MINYLHTPLIDIGMALLILVSSIEALVKVKDMVFFLLLLFSLLVVTANTAAYITEKLVMSTSLSTSILLIGASWLYWKKYRNRLFFYFTVGAVVLLLSKIYRFY
jgi:hypothetical protein